MSRKSRRHTDYLQKTLMVGSAVLALVLPTILPAQEDDQTVILSSRDGTISITGKYLGFENGAFIVDTGRMGIMRIDARRVNCSGTPCVLALEGAAPPAEPAAEPAAAPEPEVAAAEPVPAAEPAAAPEAAPAGDSILRVAATSGLTSRLVPSVIDGFLASKGFDAGTQNINLTDTTATDAFAALLNGEVDIIFTDRRATNAEIDAFLAAGAGDLLSAERETIFAQDGVVVVTSPLSPVRSISIEEAEGVFSGRITNWSELGGPDLPIRVLLPSEGSAVAEQFRATVLDPAFSDFAPTADRTIPEADIGPAVAASEDAIALVSSAQLSGARPLVLLRSCGIEARATSFNIRAEDYPLARRVYAYTTGANPLAAEAAAFLTTQSGQTYVDAAGFVSLDPEAADFDRLGKRLAYAVIDRETQGELDGLRRFVSEVIGAQRLSTTLRFATGSSQLDNKARADAIRLAELLERPDYAGAEVLLIGFTDSLGKGDLNALLSQRRAGQVLDDIVAANPGIDVSRFKVLGFGEAYPSACNDDDGGRDLNRRVEVWIR